MCSVEFKLNVMLNAEHDAQANTQYRSITDSLLDRVSAVPSCN